MNAAVRNSRRLLEDAVILLEASRFPSAASLAILSIEEAGKLAILRRMAVAQEDTEILACWRQYRSHRDKNVAWIMHELARRGARTLADLAPIFDRSSDHPDVLDSVKQLGFYTDCYADKHWSEPSEVIDQELSRILVAIATTLCPGQETTEREVQLWCQHVGPHWQTPGMAAGVMEYLRALKREGLTERSLEEMAEFMLGPATAAGVSEL